MRSIRRKCGYWVIGEKMRKREVMEADERKEEEVELRRSSGREGGEARDSGRKDEKRLNDEGDRRELMVMSMMWARE